MLLNRLDTLRVRAADGLASAADRAGLAEAGVDAEALALEWGGVRQLVVESLYGGAVPELSDDVLSALDIDDPLAGLVAESLAVPFPDIASDVLSQLGLVDVLDGLVAESLDPGRSPELADAVISTLQLDADLDIRSLVSGALSDDSPPELADDVLAAIGGDAGLRSLVDDVLGTDEIPELADAVLDALGIEDELGALVSESLDAGEAPDLWSGVATQLDGNTDAGELLREAMAADIDNVDIADAVMAELGLNGAAAAPTAKPSGAEVVPLFGGRSVLMGTILAIAAALLLYIVPGAPVEAPYEPSGEGFAYNIQDNNSVEIEELESSPDAMVQIFQTEEGAPTIIFIDELGEENSEGVEL
jgi:hypothetical protein